MTSLANAALPAELWINIISFMDREDLISATFVSQQFLCIAQSHLFSRVEIPISFSPDDIWNTSYEFKVQNVLDRINFLSTTDRISKAVKHLVVVNPMFDYDPEAASTLMLLDKIFNVILPFCNLMSFSGHGLTIAGEHMRRLLSSPHLISLVLSSCSIDTTSNHKQQCFDDAFPPLCSAFRELRLRATSNRHQSSAVGWWASFISHSTTKTLEFSTGPDSDYMLHLLSLSHSPSMAALHSLTLTKLTSTTIAEFITTLTHCPSLGSLAISDYDQSVDVLEQTISQSPNAAPVLEYAIVPYCLARPLARYRGLRHISVMHNDSRFISAEETHSLFEALYEGSSRSTLQSFIFTSEKITTETIPLFFTKFPNLRDGSIRVIRDDFPSTDNVLSFLSTAEFPRSLRRLHVVDVRPPLPERDLARSYPDVVVRLDQVCPQLHALMIATKTIRIRWSTRRRYVHTTSKGDLGLL
ncbi:hypothetical protein ABKN59_002279 [Abortiporus biennis]